MLTHEQAAFLRAVNAFAITSWTWADHEFEGDLHKMVPFAKKSGEAIGLNELGRAALAAYDAKYVVVEREHLEELRDTANASYQADKSCYDGYPHHMSKLEPTRLAIEHADAVLRGKRC